MAPENNISNFLFPKDIIQKGKEMTDAYFNIYLIENFLRLFIEKVAISAYGYNYIDKIKIGSNLNKKIEERKSDEKRKQWLSIRGDSNLFYIDLIDLKTIISSNWELFKVNFPKESWITSKMEELYDLRIKVAHNSYLDQHEQNTLESTINSIYRQLNIDFKVKKQDQFKDADDIVEPETFEKILENLGLKKKERKILTKNLKKVNFRHEEHFDDNLILEISTLMSEIRLLIQTTPVNYDLEVRKKMDELLLRVKPLIDKSQREALGKMYILFNHFLGTGMKKTQQTLFDAINMIILGR